MSSLDLEALLRPQLLAGKVVLLSAPLHDDAPRADGLAAAVGDGCAALGATVTRCAPHATEEALLDEAVKAAVLDTGAIDLLVLDGAALFSGALADAAAEAAAPAGGHAALRACLDTTWNVTRAVINHAFLPGERGGRIVFLAPSPTAGEFAETARAGLENLARTLSVEWARHGVNVVCIAPGASTAASEVASVCAYLASPAGAYFSGCLLDLRGV